MQTDELHVLVSDGKASRVLRLSLAGKLDVATIPLLEREVGRLRSSQARMLVLELAGLRCASVAGVRAMTAALDAGPWVYGRVVNPSPAVRRAFVLSGHALLIGQFDVCLPLAPGTDGSTRRTPDGSRELELVEDSAPSHVSCTCSST